ncbi:MAG: hypothetical protein IPJ98_18200 [Bryobacterales bacterium]|nr:hypothetical protein [Bryobacterales bacterium]
MRPFNDFDGTAQGELSAGGFAGRHGEHAEADIEAVAQGDARAGRKGAGGEQRVVAVESAERGEGAEEDQFKEARLGLGELDGIERGGFAGEVV